MNWQVELKTPRNLTFLNFIKRLMWWTHWGASHDPWSLMFVPLYNPFHLSRGGAYDLLLATRIGWRWWDIILVISLHYIRLSCYQACSKSLLLVLKKGATMNPQLQETEGWQYSHGQESLHFPRRASRGEPSSGWHPDCSRAGLESPAEPCSGSWPEGLMR